MYESNAERLKLLEEMLIEQQITSPNGIAPLPLQAPPAKPPRRRSFSAILIDANGHIQPIHRPQRIKAEPMRKGCKPPLRATRKPAPAPFKPSICDRAIARYLVASPPPAIPDPVAVPVPVPVPVPFPVVRKNRTTEPRPREVPRVELDALDLKALGWLKRQGYR